MAKKYPHPTDEEIANMVGRIMARVEFEPNTGCWLWPGAAQRGGYGSISNPTNWRITEKAHRVMFFAANPNADRELGVLHSCDTPPCCNPGHLFLGDQKDNMRDSANKGRHRLQRHPEKSSIANLGPVRSGICHPGATLSAEMVRTLRSAYPMGGTFKALAEKYGVSLMIVYNVVRRHTYRDVP